MVKYKVNYILINQSLLKSLNISSLSSFCPLKSNFLCTKLPFVISISETYSVEKPAISTAVSSLVQHDNYNCCNSN